MKRSALILSILFSLLVSAFGGVGIGMAMNWSPMLVTGGLFLVSSIPTGVTGMIAATVYREIWTGKVKEEMSALEKSTWLDGIEDFSQYVSNVGDEMQVIHAVYMGVLPDVLINNTTYPIAIQELGQEDMPITLDKYQTKSTPITDDELYALSYDKIATVKGKHSKAISRNKFKKAIHALAPGSNTAAMPVLLTTGADDGTGRKKLVVADLITLKNAIDALEIPEEGRRLVLCTDHHNDLLASDQSYRDYIFNTKSGKVTDLLYGFEIYSYVGNPYYTPSTKVKLAFGAVPADTDRKASVFFSLERAAKASGWVKMYFSEAKSDTLYQRNLMNFRHNYIVMPTREEARGAIISANV